MRLTRRLIHDFGKERIAGAALNGDDLYCWGDGLWRVPLKGGSVRTLASTGGFGAAGCWFGGIVAMQRGLVWYPATDWKPRPIDPNVLTDDAVTATILGRRGVLVVHRGMQVRLYDPSTRESRDLYSFYSDSEQGGLLLTDIDGDGRADIVCGNYWIQCPERFELSGRLYAIALWNESRQSARSAFTMLGRNLVRVQSAVGGARVAWFERPADPQRMWSEHRMEGTLNLQQPRHVTLFGGKILVAEAAGEGRLAIFHRDRAEVVARTGGVSFLHAVSPNRLLLAESSRVAWWDNQVGQ